MDYSRIGNINAHFNLPRVTICGLRRRRFARGYDGDRGARSRCAASGPNRRVGPNETLYSGQIVPGGHHVVRGIDAAMCLISGRFRQHDRLPPRWGVDTSVDGSCPDGQARGSRVPPKRPGCVHCLPVARCGYGMGRVRAPCWSNRAEIRSREWPGSSGRRWHRVACGAAA